VLLRGCEQCVRWTSSIRLATRYSPPCAIPQNNKVASSDVAVSGVYEQRADETARRFRRISVETSVTLDGRVRGNTPDDIGEAVFASLGLSIACDWMFAPSAMAASTSCSRGVSETRLAPSSRRDSSEVGELASAAARERDAAGVRGRAVSRQSRWRSRCSAQGGRMALAPA
jgi:hypothetical protein